MSNPRPPSPPNAKSADLRAKQLSSLKERMRQTAAKEGRLANPAAPSDSLDALGSSEPAGGAAPILARAERPFWEAPPGLEEPVAAQEPLSEASEPASSKTSHEPAAPLAGHVAHSHFDEWMFESDSREASPDGASAGGAEMPPPLPAEPLTPPSRAEPGDEPWADERHEPWQRPDRKPSAEPVTDLGPSPWPWERDDEAQPVAAIDPRASESERREALIAHEADFGLRREDDAVGALGEDFELSPSPPHNAAAEMDRRAALDSFRKEARARAESAHAGLDAHAFPLPAEGPSTLDFVEPPRPPREGAATAAQAPEPGSPASEELIPQRRLSLRERLGDLDGPDEETPSLWDQEWADEEDFEAITREALAAMASGKTPTQEEPETDAIPTIVSPSAPPTTIASPEILVQESAHAPTEAQEDSPGMGMENSGQMETSAPEAEIADGQAPPLHESRGPVAAEEKNAADATDATPGAGAAALIADGIQMSAESASAFESAPEPLDGTPPLKAPARPDASPAEAEPRSGEAFFAQPLAEGDLQEGDPQDTQNWADAVRFSESEGFGDSSVSFTADDFDFDIPERLEPAPSPPPDSSATREFDPEAEMPIERSEPKGKPLPDGPVSLKDMIARARTVVEKSRDERPVNDAPRRTGFDALAERARKAVARRETAWGLALDPDRIGRRGQEIVLSEFAAGGFQEGLIAVFEKGWDSDLASGELSRAASEHDQWELLDWLERLGARPADAKAANRLRQWQRENNIKPEPSSLARTPGGMMFDRNNLSQPDSLAPLFTDSQHPQAASAAPSQAPAKEEGPAEAQSDEAATLSAMDSFGFDDLGLDGVSENDGASEESAERETQDAGSAPAGARAGEGSGPQREADFGEHEPSEEASTLDAIDAFGLDDLGLSDEKAVPLADEPIASEPSSESSPEHFGAPAESEPHDEATLLALGELGFDALGDAIKSDASELESHSLDVGASLESAPEPEDEPPLSAHEERVGALPGHDESARADASSFSNEDWNLAADSADNDSLANDRADREIAEPHGFDGDFDATPLAGEAPGAAALHAPARALDAETPRSSLRETVAVSQSSSPLSTKGTIEEQLAAARERNTVLQARLLDAMGLEDDFFAMEERAEIAERELTRVREELFFAQAALKVSEEKMQSGSTDSLAIAEAASLDASPMAASEAMAPPKDSPPAMDFSSNALSEAERTQWERDQQRLKNLADLNELAEDDQRRALLAIQTARKAQKDAQAALAAEQERVLALTAHDWLVDTATDAQRQSLLASALAQAAQAGDLSVLERAWLNSVADPEERDAALAFACEKGHLECAAWLLAETRANPNGLHGLPVFRAAKAQQVDALRLLRSWGGDWSKDGEHALRLVCAGDNAEGARVLIDAGCNPGAQNSRALREAIEAQAWRAAVVLIEAGASPLSDNGSLWPAVQERSDLRDAFETARKTKENMTREQFGFSAS